MRRWFGLFLEAMVGVILCLIAVLSMATVLSGCHDGCEPEATRCHGTIIEVCNSEADWESEMNCSNIESFEEDLDWECCIDPEDGFHSCLPSDECDDPDGGS